MSRDVVNPSKQIYVGAFVGATLHHIVVALELAASGPAKSFVDLGASLGIQSVSAEIGGGETVVFVVVEDVARLFGREWLLALAHGVGDVAPRNRMRRDVALAQGEHEGDVQNFRLLIHGLRLFSGLEAGVVVGLEVGRPDLLQTWVANANSARPSAVSVFTLEIAVGRERIAQDVEANGD